MMRHRRLISIVLTLPLLLALTPTTVRAQSQAVITYTDTYAPLEIWLGGALQRPSPSTAVAFSGAFFPRDTVGQEGTH